MCSIVKTLNNVCREVETLGGYGTGGDVRDLHGRPANFHSRVKDVSCGGGFTLAVTHGGKVDGSPRRLTLFVCQVALEQNKRCSFPLNGAPLHLKFLRSTLLEESH